ncbi:hypothetical protein M3172_08785 [Mesobacillus subterraneus]|uniref:hypothetical protein n=1 Tax=Mesobacillus subterraneus TaxID=285983 RepID=UPI00203D41F7|nr:hypothetical protein [Mesobacillus subterraneus]MCM3573289.1 hypothetical protein [Mesobacillus subterraneus]
MVGFIGGPVTVDTFTVLHRGEVILPLKDAEKMKEAFKNLGKNSFDTINIVLPTIPERK